MLSARSRSSRSMAPTVNRTEWFERRTDLMLDVILCLELMLLAALLLMWHPPVQPFPPILFNPNNG